MKRFILGLSTLTVTTIPIATVVACSCNDDNTDADQGSQNMGDVDYSNIDLIGGIRGVIGSTFYSFNLIEANTFMSEEDKQVVDYYKNQFKIFEHKPEDLTEEDYITRVTREIMDNDKINFFLPGLKVDSAVVTNENITITFGIAKSYYFYDGEYDFNIQSSVDDKFTTTFTNEEINKMIQWDIDFLVPDVLNNFEELLDIFGNALDGVV